ncbi:MAG TPA: L-histidine N(alpha)-methyltransferase [Salinimicrobium sp.]|nr:L-histidine N(alpha)-methyltransferase [Salinimicrobium sp.]
MEKKSRDQFSQFEKEVFDGLSASPKYLSSKFFYDETGDEIFRQIMDLPQYYPTKSEFEIIKNHAADFGENFSSPDGLDLFELGSGDGIKTKYILKQLLRQNEDFIYYPTDISRHSLKGLKITIGKELPELKVKPFEGTYHKTLAHISNFNRRKKVIIMLGSNIGNLLHREAIEFLRSIRRVMSKGDMLLMGFDQKKDPSVILAAYNDPQGVTEQFNKNLLLRINREMGADFNTEQFLHWPLYDPETGTAKSFLLSKIRQQVKIPSIGLTAEFSKWETIHTEISQKYDDAVIEWLAKESGLKIFTSYSDEKEYYKNFIFI